MNRVLYNKNECAHDQLLLTDYRATHILKVLKSRPGDILRTGELDGPLSKGEVIKVGEQKVLLKITDQEVPLRPSLDLMLAMPRPKVLKRLLSQISAIGVDHLYLCNASRVEKYYFDTHVLEADFLKKALVEGLMQSGDTCLPRVEVLRHLPSFLEKPIFPENRWLLDPYAGGSFLEVPVLPGRRVLAIGPEGGWREDEQDLFVAKGFKAVKLFDRILRSDTACISALSMAVAKGGGDGSS